jgi:hypothetical protein
MKRRPPTKASPKLTTVGFAWRVDQTKVGTPTATHSANAIKKKRPTPTSANSCMLSSSVGRLVITAPLDGRRDARWLLADPRQLACSEALAEFQSWRVRHPHASDRAGVFRLGRPQVISVRVSSATP